MSLLSGLHRDSASAMLANHLRREALSNGHGGKGLEMNMPRHAPMQEELLAKLVRLANGDNELVNEAIRANSVNGVASMEAVVRYIVDHIKHTHETAA